MNNYTDHKSLGCYKGPSGNLKAQKEELTKKSRTFAKIVRSVNLSRLEADMMYKAIFIPSIGY